MAIVVESHHTGDPTVLQRFRVFEYVSCTVFTLEYVMRLWACVADRRFGRPGGRLSFSLTPMALIDLAAILPTLVFFIDIDLRFVRILRVLRIGRVLKLGKYSRSLRVIGAVLRDKKADLMGALFVVAVLLLTTSTLIYYAERDAQPDAFPNISAALWWGVVTMTTVGYGDVFPITLVGKFFAALVCCLSLGLFALPAGILADGYKDVSDALDAAEVSDGPHCPSCGQPVATVHRDP